MIAKPASDGRATTGSARVVGIDYGTRRVGIAKSDPFLMFAQPVGTYAPDKAVEVVCAIAAEDGLHAIVIGWPLDNDGHENTATARVDAYVARLRGAIPDLDVVRWDERGSSRAALGELIRAGAGRKQRGRTGAKDRVAAALILQEYLDERNADDTHAF